MADCCSVSTAEAAPPVLPCPVSGTRSKQVDLRTVKALVRHLPFGLPATQYYFCEAPNCEVVYFGAWPDAPRFSRSDLLVPVRAKETDPRVPVCYCYGVTPRDIEEEISRTGKSTVVDRIKAEVKARNCACEVKNPSGKCCLGAVSRAVQDSLAKWGTRELTPGS